MGHGVRLVSRLDIRKAHRGSKTSCRIVNAPSAVYRRNGGRLPCWRAFNDIAGDVETAGQDLFQVPQLWSRFEKLGLVTGYAPAQLRRLALAL
ncbi:MAG: hypothetical protein KJ587_10740 [Alphaproteobacteria bacterium]|nr:hypothetical protein [Alphaproteobacteria bacterium]